LKEVVKATPEQATQEQATPEQAPSRKPPSGKAQVLIVDDHPIVRHGIAQLLNCETDMEAAAEAAEAETALRLLRERRFDLVISDISMPGLSGLDLIRRVQALANAPPVLVLSMHEESVYAERALAAGARGFVMKQEAPDKLVSAVRKVITGGRYLSTAREERMLRSIAAGRSKPASPGLSVLNEREFEVLQLIAQGLTSSRLRSASVARSRAWRPIAPHCAASWAPSRPSILRDWHWNIFQTRRAVPAGPNTARIAPQVVPARAGTQCLSRQAIGGTPARDRRAWLSDQCCGLPGCFARGARSARMHARAKLREVPG
jgi:DNA-binding NarL/FixJ family response regulator